MNKLKCHSLIFCDHIIHKGFNEFSPNLEVLLRINRELKQRLPQICFGELAMRLPNDIHESRQLSFVGADTEIQEAHMSAEQSKAAMM